MLWDIGASWVFNETTLEYCKKGDIVACVYAMSDRNSFLDCQTIAERLLKEDRMRYDAKVVLVGTKSDLPVEVTYFEGV